MSYRPLIILFPPRCLQQHHLLFDMSYQYQNLLQYRLQQPWMDNKDDFMSLVAHISQGAVCLLMQHWYLVFGSWPTIIHRSFLGELLLIVGLVFEVNSKRQEWSVLSEGCSLFYLSVSSRFWFWCVRVFKVHFWSGFWLGCVIPALDAIQSMLSNFTGDPLCC